LQRARLQREVVECRSLALRDERSAGLLPPEFLPRGHGQQLHDAAHGRRPRRMVDASRRAEARGSLRRSEDESARGLSLGPPRGSSDRSGGRALAHHATSFVVTSVPLRNDPEATKRTIGIVLYILGMLFGGFLLVALLFFPALLSQHADVQ